PAAGLRIALAARLRRLVLVVAGGVQVLVVHLPHRAGADALPVPDVGPFAGVREVLVAEGLALARVAGRHAAPSLEGGRADVPDHRGLVFVVEVVVAALVVGVRELLPRAVGLLHPRAPPETLRRVLVLHEEKHRVPSIDRTEGHFGRAAG